MTRTVMGPGERRRELLACAMRLFAEEGYDNVSVRAVARAAGVAPVPNKRKKTTIAKR